MLYASFAAGVFEETGRRFGFCFLSVWLIEAVAFTIGLACLLIGIRLPDENAEP